MGREAERSRLPMKLTKIDIAEAHIRAAVRMFFAGEHPVPVFTLANAAREIVATIGDQTEVETLQQELATERGVSVKQLLAPLRAKANFFKHADQDAGDTIEFNEDDAVITLRLACQDFHRITGGIPREAQVFDLWVYAVAFPKVSVAPPHKQDRVRAAHPRFPGIGEELPEPRKRRSGLRPWNARSPTRRFRWSLSGKLSCPRSRRRPDSRDDRSPLPAAVDRRRLPRHSV